MSTFRCACAGGAKHRRKGDRIEREIVALHRALGIHSERYPLSGASRFRDTGHDVDVYLFGVGEAPIVTEMKGRKNGAGFTTIERWLGECDGFSSAATEAIRRCWCHGASGPAWSNGCGDERKQAPPCGAARQINHRCGLVKEWFKQWPNALLAIDAVDMTYSAAQWAGLPDTVSDDAIQHVLSASFANARRP